MARMEAPDMIRFGDRFFWRWRWSGWKDGFRCVWVYSEKRYGEFYIGFKLGSSVPGLGFALRFRPWARVGQ